MSAKDQRARALDGTPLDPVCPHWCQYTGPGHEGPCRSLAVPAEGWTAELVARESTGWRTRLLISGPCSVFVALEEGEPVAEMLGLLGHPGLAGAVREVAALAH